MPNQIILGDNLDILPRLPDKLVRLCYIDPPFGTNKIQKRDRLTVKAVSSAENADRKGFGGRSYETTYDKESPSYLDKFDDFESFLMPRIDAAIHALTDDGALFVHLDHRESHYIKVALDKLLGRNRFLNEIIWSFDYGARSKTRWPQKHNTILVYVMNPKSYVFNYDAMDRIPYKSGEGLVSKEKLARGKTPTSVWEMTIVPTNSKEKTRTGKYPTAKPVALLNRIVKVHSNPNDIVLDFFGGSGTTGEAAATNGRNFILIDQNPESVKIMANRLKDYTPELIDF